MLYRLFFMFSVPYTTQIKKRHAYAHLQPANAFCIMVSRGDIGKIPLPLIRIE